ncbi:YkvA family protein [Albibacterium profundi]|uniref:YkvA family protein n=1 Tax=Albibacterium profundi TaxID=3134906 RepID=A0ABV5CA50_9SPHI
MKKVELSLKELYRRFGKSETRASQLVKDKEKTQRTIEKALMKANANRNDLTGVWDQLQSLFSLVRDYTNGSYKSIPKKSLIAILAGIVYFLSPVDMFPDFVLGFGLVDDMFIIGLVIKQVSKDLEKYQLWKAEQEVSVEITNQYSQ